MRHAEAKRFDSCATCLRDKPLSTAKTCRACYKKTIAGKQVGRPIRSGTEVWELSDAERECYEAILAHREWTLEDSHEARIIVASAVAKGTLAQELEFWTTGPDQEPPHKTTSLGLMSAFAPGVIQ